MSENSVEKVVQIESESFRPELVVEDMLGMAANRRNGLEPEDGPILIVGGGGQRGPFGGGGVTAVQKIKSLGSLAFKSVFGVSTGAPTVSYYLVGQSEEGTSIYSTENTIDKEFINLRRVPIMDIDWLCNIFSNGNEEGYKKLDVTKMLANPTGLYYAVTDSFNGSGRLLNAKVLNNPIEEGIKPSCAVPELYGKEIEVDSEGVKSRYVDGGVALPLPIKEAFAIRRPTSLVIFANRPKNFSDGFFSKWLAKYASLVVKEPFPEAILHNDIIFNEQIKFLKESGVPYIIFWTDASLRPLEQNPKKLKNAADNFEKYVTDFFKKYL